MKATKLTTLFLLLSSNLLNAQLSDTELQNRYFTARNRLKKWFVEVGNVEGKCLIPDGINFGNTPFWLTDHIIRLPNGQDSFITSQAWNTNSYQNVINSEPWGFMVYDNPGVMLGRYLGILSTEYWLLKYYGKQNSSEEVM